jgi:branched-subunit amino acid aminotransferase/4-amino-4-deoxychorismate lyase
VVLDLCAKLGIPTREFNITPDELARAEGVFLSLSSLGVVEGVSLDGKLLARSPVTKRLWGAYQELVRDETALTAGLTAS